MEFSSYKQVPQSIADEIIRKKQEEKKKTEYLVHNTTSLEMARRMITRRRPRLLIQL
jgi:hypothetical protein